MSKTLVEQVKNEAQLRSDSEHFDLGIDVSGWERMSQMGHLNGIVFACSIYLYDKHNINSTDKLKQIKKIVDKDEKLKNVVNSLLLEFSENEKKERNEFFKATLIKYLFNMIQFKIK